jgi:hypothetical protein
MISRYRNRSILWFVFATVLTAAFGVAFASVGKMTHDNWIVLLMFLYLGAVSLWMVGCFNLAKAKGYGDDQVGGMFLLLFVLGCIIPFAPCIFPLGVLFLKDKTRRRHVHHRRDDTAA